MTRKLAVFGAVLALGAMMVGTTLTGASAGTGEEIQFRAVTTESGFVDVGETGTSLGDEFIFHDVLKHAGAKIGHDGGVCTVTSVRGPESQCLVTGYLSGGPGFALQGLSKDTGKLPVEFVFAVTGGTGQYQGASGEAHVVVVSDTVARVAHPSRSLRPASAGPEEGRLPSRSLRVHARGISLLGIASSVQAEERSLPSRRVHLRDRSAYR